MSIISIFFIPLIFVIVILSFIFLFIILYIIFFLLEFWWFYIVKRRKQKCSLFFKLPSFLVHNEISSLFDSLLIM
jgi:hypothetical protein